MSIVPPDPWNMAKANSASVGGEGTWQDVIAALSATYAPLEVLNRSALLPFWAALANRDAATVRLMAVGDSISAGGRCGTWPAHYAGVLAKRLAAAYPCLSGNPVGGYYQPADQSSSNGPQPPLTLTTGNDATGYYGPGFRNLVLNGTNTATFTVVGTSFTLWNAVAGGTRSYSMSIDGAAAVTVTVPGVAGGSDANLQHFTFTGAGTHTIAITYTGDPVNLAGIDVFNGDESKGIHWIPAGHGNWTAHDFIAHDNTGDSTLPLMASGSSPSLITIMLGVNDWGNGTATSAAFGADLTTMVARLKSGAPNAAVLLIAPPVTAQQLTPIEPYANYVTAMKAVAQADPTTAYIDLSKTLPAATAAKTYGLYYTDQIHPLAPGHTMIADLLFSAVRPPSAQ